MLGEGDSLPRDRKRFHGRNEQGHWFPSFEATIEEMREELTSRFADPLAVVQRNEPDLVLNRALRRKATREMRAGRAAKAMGLDIRQNWPMVVGRLREMFPVSEVGERQWRKLLVGSGSSNQTARAMQDDLADLPAVMEWLTPSSGPLSEIPRWLRSSSDKFVDMYQAIRERAEAARSDAEPVLGKAKLESLWKKSRIADRNNIQARIVTNTVALVQGAERRLQKSFGLRLEDALSMLDREGAAVLPSQVALSAIIAANLRKNASPFEQRRNLDKVASDVGDVLHAVYIPYVDVLRVDKFSEAYLSPIAKEFGTKIVKRRGDLPSEIIGLLSRPQSPA